jgi:hypothetical protein
MRIIQRRPGCILVRMWPTGAMLSPHDAPVGIDVVVGADRLQKNAQERLGITCWWPQQLCHQHDTPPTAAVRTPATISCSLLDCQVIMAVDSPLDSLVKDVLGYAA